MRVYAIWLAFSFMTAYAWANWFRAMCFLIVAMAIVERPDMPKQVLGLPGLNPWNILFLATLLAFLFSNKKNTPKLPSNLKWLSYFYVCVVFSSFVRGAIDMDGHYEFAIAFNAQILSFSDLVLEDVLNTAKYASFALLGYYACDSQTKIKQFLISIALMNLLLGIQIIKSMGLTILTTDAFTLEQTGIRRIDRDVGYFRSDLAVLLAGGSWAIYSLKDIATSKLQKYAAISGSIITALSLGLTGGRLGLVAWGVIALIMGAIRWKIIIVVSPIVLVLALTIDSPVKDRLLQGIGLQNEAEAHRSDRQKAEELNLITEGNIDLVSVTSGRAIVWPVIIEEIKESPWFGYGRRAMTRMGISDRLAREYGETFAHPHNAYLQLLLDNGFLLATPVFVFYGLLLLVSFRLLRDSDSEINRVVGSFGFVFILSFLLGCVGQQSFYPFIGSVSIWASIGVVLRVYADQTAGVQQPK